MSAAESLRRRASTTATESTSRPTAEQALGRRPTAVEVRRNAGLAALVGAVAAGVAIAYLARAVEHRRGARLGAVRGDGVRRRRPPAALVDARTPLLVADAQGVRLRLGRSGAAAVGRAAPGRAPAAPRLCATAAWCWCRATRARARGARRVRPLAARLPGAVRRPVRRPAALATRVIGADATSPPRSTLAEVARVEAVARRRVEPSSRPSRRRRRRRADEARAARRAGRWRDPRPAIAHGSAWSRPGCATRRDARRRRGRRRTPTRSPARRPARCAPGPGRRSEVRRPGRRGRAPTAPTQESARSRAAPTGASTWSRPTVDLERAGPPIAARRRRRAVVIDDFASSRPRTRSSARSWQPPAPGSGSPSTSSPSAPGSARTSSSRSRSTTSRPAAATSTPAATCARSPGCSASTRRRCWRVRRAVRRRARSTRAGSSRPSSPPGGGSIRGTRGGPNWSVLIAAVMAAGAGLVDRPAGHGRPGRCRGDQPVLNGSAGPDQRRARAPGRAGHADRGRAAAPGSSCATAAGGRLRRQPRVRRDHEASRSSPPVRIQSTDGSLEVTVDGKERGALGKTGPRAHAGSTPAAPTVAGEPRRFASHRAARDRDASRSAGIVGERY